MTNFEQLDELAALEAVYADDDSVCLQLPMVDGAEGLEHPEVIADIAWDLPKALTLRAGDVNVRVASLRLHLRAALPSCYLAADCDNAVPPRVELRAAWLPREWRQRFCDELDCIWCEQAGAPVLFSWIEWLRRDALALIVPAFGSNLELDVEGLQAVDLEALAAWDRRRRPEADRGEPQLQCDNCASLGVARSVVQLGFCEHSLCIACLGLVARLHGPSRPLCPLEGCRMPVDGSVVHPVAERLPEPDDAGQRILGKPLQASVVFCPRCEDLGVDTPVLTSGNTVHLAAGVLENCTCPSCDWHFCGVCRSPCHDQECTVEAGRAARLLKRRPPLPPGSATERALRATRSAVAKAEMLAQLCSAFRSVDAATSQRPRKSEEDRLTAEAELLLKLDENAALWFSEQGAAAQQEKLLVYKDGEDQQDVPDDYDSMRWGLVGLYREELTKSLTRELREPVRLKPLPVSRDVCERFMKAVRKSSDVIRPAFHGSNAQNYPSIVKRGLLIPGQGNELRIVNGAAHGYGVYTANVDSAWLSAGFCSEPRMLVCAVLDSHCVRHVGDAMVVGNDSHVVPLFEASSVGFVNKRASRQQILANKQFAVGQLAAVLRNASATPATPATAVAVGVPSAADKATTVPSKVATASTATVKTVVKKTTETPKPSEPSNATKNKKTAFMLRIEKRSQKKR